MEKYRVGLIISMIIFLGLKLLFVIWPFWGLEYEDSFIFNEASRLIYEGKFLLTENLAFATIVDGSYEKVNSMGIYGGHFIIFPYLISIVHFLFGYNLSNIFILNFIFSSAIPILLWFNRRKLDLSYFQIIAYITIYVSTPYINTFNTSGLSETLSSLIVFYAVTLLLIILNHFNKSSQGLISYRYLIYVLIVFVLAIYTKRENIVLIFPIAAICILIFRKIKSWYILIYFSFFVIVAAVYYKIHNPWQIEILESDAILGSTFSFEHLRINIISLLIGFFSWSIWGWTGVLFLISLLLLVYLSSVQKLSNYSALIVLTTVICYIGVYSLHYRSYYTVISPKSNPHDSLRYAVNYTPILILFIIMVFKEINLKKYNIFLVKISLISVLALSVLNTISFRKTMSFIEKIEVTADVKKTLIFNKKHLPIITDIPSVYRCFSDKNQRIIDLYAIKDLIHEKGDFSGEFLLVHRKNNNIEIKRFAYDSSIFQKIRMIQSSNKIRINIVKFNVTKIKPHDQNN